MTITKVKTYVLIGLSCYTLFVGWYFYRSHELSKTRWQPSDVYTQIGDISETMGATAAPTANQVFDAKVNVPMTSRSKHRIANYKRTNKRPARIMALNRRKSSSSMSVISPTNTSSITPVGEGLYTLSSATFRSFGAWGLMNPSYGRMRRTNQTKTTQVPEATTIYLYPWYIHPQPTEKANQVGGQSVITPPPSQLTFTGKN